MSTGINIFRHFVSLPFMELHVLSYIFYHITLPITIITLPIEDVGLPIPYSMIINRRCIYYMFNVQNFVSLHLLFSKLQYTV